MLHLQHPQMVLSHHHKSVRVPESAVAAVTAVRSGDHGTVATALPPVRNRSEIQTEYSDAQGSGLPCFQPVIGELLQQV